MLSCWRAFITALKKLLNNYSPRGVPWLFFLKSHSVGERFNKMGFFSKIKSAVVGACAVVASVVTGLASAQTGLPDNGINETQMITDFAGEAGVIIAAVIGLGLAFAIGYLLWRKLKKAVNG